jgi:hypothetical protein
MMREAINRSTKPADPAGETDDPFVFSLLARSWMFRVAAASCLIVALWAMIFWAVSLP